MSSASILDSQVSFEALTLLDQDRCAICLGEIECRTELDSCTHSFCQDCIKTWSKSRRLCPLCKAEFRVLHTNIKTDGTFEEELVPVPAAKKADVGTDLECLDHTYFLRETKRLLSTAQESQRSMVRSQKQNAHTKFGSKFSSSWEERNWDSLASIVARLTDMAQLFRSDEQFDPFTILQQLYAIQTEMELVWRSPMSTPSKESSSPNARYSANDYDDLSSDSEDEYCYEFEGGSNRKQDRKVSGRLPKQPASQKKKK